MGLVAEGDLPTPPSFFTCTPLEAYYYLGCRGQVGLVAEGHLLQGLAPLKLPALRPVGNTDNLIKCNTNKLKNSVYIYSILKK